MKLLEQTGKWILVLTNSLDGEHSSVVIQKLRQRGENVFRLDVDKIATGEISVAFNVNTGDIPHFVVETANGRYSSRDQCVKSIWYRRPNHFSLTIKDFVQRQFAEEEMHAFLEGLWLIMPENIFWLSHPACLERARRKMVQMQIAEKIGLCMPRTIVTSNPDRVREFIDKSKGQKIVFKTLHHNFFDYGDRGFTVPTTILTEKHMAQLNLISATPSIFQDFIEKVYEIRVTIVGEQIFPVRIDSQEFSETSVDWRKPQFIEKLRHRIVEMPNELAQKCQSMMQELGISFAAFDFVVGNKEDSPWYFLEVNPNGQWYWLEHLTGACISDAIVDILSIGSNLNKRR